MKPFLKPASLVLAATLGLTSIATAAEINAVTARQGQFRLMAFNIGTLAAMAKGEADYDAAAAQIAADNLVALSSLDQSHFWPEGSDAMSIDNTRALPVIMDDFAGFSAKWDGFGTAARAMQAVAGEGLDDVRGAIGGLGGACGACHKAYRAPE